MMNEKVKLGKIAFIAKGYGIKRSELTYDEPKPKNNRLMRVAMLRTLYALSNNIHCNVEPLYFEKPEQKYNKEILYVQKHDIVIPVLSSGYIKVIYFEDEPSEKFIYTNTSLVIRVNEDIVSSKYVYIKLLSPEVQRKLIWNGTMNVNDRKKLKEALRAENLLDSLEFMQRYTKKILSEIEIEILGKEEDIKICNEYENLMNKRKKLDSEFNKFFKSI